MATDVWGTEIVMSVASALIDLLRDKPMSSITVSELCKKAEISRTTYYRYFDSKEEVLDYGFDVLARQYHEEVAKTRRHASYIQYENILLVFQQFQQYADIIRVLLQNNMGGKLQRFIIEDELERSLRSREEEHDKYLVVAYASAIYGILVQWIEDDMKEPPEELAHWICDIYQPIIRRY